MERLTHLRRCTAMGTGHRHLTIWLAKIGGTTFALLGGLWLLQGLGIVHVKPILCFADCAEIQGQSATWSIVGGVVLSVGIILIFWRFKRQAKE
jgi:LPXTG-motif cell wall-anchored protein